MTARKIGIVRLQAAAIVHASTPPGVRSRPHLHRLFPDDQPVASETLDRIEQLTGTRVTVHPDHAVTAARCRATLTQWALSERAREQDQGSGSDDRDQVDDGSRRYAVSQWGEDQVTDHEIQTVQQHPQLGAAFFRRLGVPEHNIRVALDAAAADQR